MPSQNLLLEDRAVVRVTGEDAQSFLQGIFTNDVKKLSGENLQYTLLLTPQGQVLQDVFLFLRDNAYFIDVEKSMLDDLLRRMTMYRLRSKVSWEMTDLSVVSCQDNDGSAFADPRYADLGFRKYTNPVEGQYVFGADDYAEFCLSQGVPNGTRTIRCGKDFAHDVNLDCLGAFSWNKGCFIGQEVAARVENRGLVKKRLMILDAGEAPEGADVRQASRQGHPKLVIFRIAEKPDQLRLPPYMT